MSDDEMIFELGKVLTFGFVARGPMNEKEPLEDKVVVILERIFKRHLSDGDEPQYRRDIIKEILETAAKIAKGEPVCISTSATPVDASGNTKATRAKE